MNKSILKVVGVVAVATALCVGCGGDNGVSGVDPAVCGTWARTNDNVSLTLNRDGTASFSTSASAHWKYTTNGTNLTLTVTEVYHEKTGKWLNREQYSKVVEEEIKDLEEQMKNLDPSAPFYETSRSLIEFSISFLRAENLTFLTVNYTYSVDGNTLTLCLGSNCTIYTKQ